MIRTSCLSCGSRLEIDNIHEGEGYFFGYDTDYYGDYIEARDSHEVIGYYCKVCGDNLRGRAEAMGWEKD